MARPSFARRVAPAVLLGTAAVAAVALFDPVFGSSDTANLLAAPSTDSGGITTSTSTTNKAGSSSNNSSTKSSSTKSNSGSSATPSASSNSGSTDCSNGTVIDSATVNSRYGPIQIEATVANGAICSVTTLQEPSGDGRTNYISQQVMPWLNKQAVKVGVDFQAISGATFTSEGYRQALQSVLDQM